MHQPDELSERDWRIIRHVFRYRVSTERVIWKLYFPELELSAARNVIRRLVQLGWLQKIVLDGQRKMITLDTRGNCACGLRERARHRFSDQTLVTFFSVLFYCLRTGSERLTTVDLHAIAPEFDNPFTRAHAYFVRESDNGRNLSCFLVDRGVSARRLVTRLHSLLVKHYRLPRFRDLNQAGRLSVTILTAHANNVEPLTREIIARHRGRAKVFVEVVPEMTSFLPSRR